MKDNIKKEYKFHVHGMHCNACVILIESELNNLKGVSNVVANLGNKMVVVSGNFDLENEVELADYLSQPIKSSGYHLSVEREIVKSKISDFKYAVPIAIAFAFIFVILQKIGLIGLIGGSGVNYGSAFVIGIVASLSTCMAVVGGLLLSMSATFAKEGDKTRPQIMFHISRLVAFFILGGTIGFIGKAFTLSAGGILVLGILTGIVMLILGINLLDLFHFTKKLQPAMPKFIAKYAHGVQKLNHTLTPALVGIATFFLPCGFTQSMQLYTLTTQSFWVGALTMLAFALGTLPVLALLSFSSFSIKDKSYAGIFFKSAGLIVILFALFNIINSLAAYGIISPLFNF